MIQSISNAEGALERGDYGQCINFLEPLIDKYPLTTIEGSNIRMILVTAYIGSGENQKAISTCRLLTKSSNKDIRQKAKDLLPILQAPSLTRPSNWSIEIPKLDQNPTKKYLTNTSRKKFFNENKKSYHPPTGEIKSLDLGFTILVFIVVSLLFFVLN